MKTENSTQDVKENTKISLSEHVGGKIKQVSWGKKKNIQNFKMLYKNENMGSHRRQVYKQAMQENTADTQNQTPTGPGFHRCLINCPQVTLLWNSTGWIWLGKKGARMGDGCFLVALDRLLSQGKGWIPDETSQRSHLAMIVEKWKVPSCYSPPPTVPAKPRWLSVQGSFFLPFSLKISQHRNNHKKFDFIKANDKQVNSGSIISMTEWSVLEYSEATNM